MAWKKWAVGALASAAICANAQSSVTIYGLFDIGVDIAKSGPTRVTREISGGSFGSRLGFRGVEDLGGGASAVFRLESGFAGDSGVFGQGGLAFGREASVGLARNDLGTVTLGRIPTPVSLAQAHVDAFFWMGGGGMISITRSAAGTTQILPQVVSARADNAVNYQSPAWNGFEFRALASAGEASTTNNRARGFSARYNANNIDALVAFGRQYGGGPAGGKIDSVVAGGSYDFKWAKVFVGYTDEDNGCGSCTGNFARAPGVSGIASSRFKLVNAGARIPFGPATAIVQVVKVADRSQYDVNPGNRDATWWALGGEYALSRRTALYASVASIGNRNGSRYALGSGGVQQAAGFGAADASSRALVLGMRHVF
jgi:predicted porin